MYSSDCMEFGRVWVTQELHQSEIGFVVEACENKRCPKLLFWKYSTFIQKLPNKAIVCASLEIHLAQCQIVSMISSSCP